MDVFPIILVVHLLLAIGLVGVVLLQRSEGGALGLGGGGGVMTGRAAGNLLTQTTSILAGLFFVTSLLLAILANGHNRAQATPFDQLPAASAVPAPASQPSAGQPNAGQPDASKSPDAAQPAAPAAPLAPQAPLAH